MEKHKINTENWLMSDYDINIKKLKDEQTKIQQRMYNDGRRYKILEDSICELMFESQLKLQQMKDDYSKRKNAHNQEGEYLEKLYDMIKSWEGIEKNTEVIKNLPINELPEIVNITVVKEYRVKGKHKPFIVNTKAGATALFINQKHVSRYRNISKSAVSKSVNSDTERTVIKDKQGNPILDKNGEKEYRTYCERQIQIKSVDVKKFYEEVKNNPEDISVLKRYVKYGNVNK